MVRSREPSAPVEIAKQDISFNKEENEILDEISTLISAKQLQAARLEAAGFDANMIASQVKTVPQTITVWRRDQDYIKAKNFFLSVINKQGLKFRIDCQRLVIAPAYVELIRRMNTPRILKSLDHKEILNTIKVVGKETRLDSVGVGATDSDEDLLELQERRNKFSFATQAQAIEDLKKESNIITFPKTGTNGN